MHFIVSDMPPCLASAVYICMSHELQKDVTFQNYIHDRGNQFLWILRLSALMLILECSPSPMSHQFGFHSFFEIMLLVWQPYFLCKSRILIGFESEQIQVRGGGHGPGRRRTTNTNNASAEFLTLSRASEKTPPWPQLLRRHGRRRDCSVTEHNSRYTVV